MNRFTRRQTLLGKLDPIYEHPRGKSRRIRVNRIYRGLYPNGVEEMVYRESPMLGVISERRNAS